MLMYWLSLGCFIALAGGRTAYRRWLQPSSGGLVWRLLPCLTFALFLPTFLLNWSRLNESWLLAIWLGVALVDPWLEEGYWRGALREATATWPGWLCIGGRRLRVDEWLRSGAAVVCRRRLELVRMRALVIV
jgi:hypothetical protein